VREPLAVLDKEMKFKRVNRAFVEDLEIQREQVEGLLLEEAIAGRWSMHEQSA
jgi:hypothetical protein